MKKYQRIFINLLTSGVETENISLKYKLVVLNICLLMGAVSLGIFFIIWTIAGNYILSVIDALVSILFWASFFSLRKAQDSEKIILLSSLMVVIAAIAFLVANRNLNFGLAWAYVVPVFIMFLMGHKKGLILSSIYYFFVAFEICIHYDLWVKEGLNWIFLSRFIITNFILTFIAFISEFSFSKINEKNYELSITDALTNVNNRRNLDSILDKEIRLQKRTNLPFCICLLDIDDFKILNDTQGHLKGDIVLKEVANIIKSSIRITDEVGRWGGEEFCILLPNTDLSHALVLIERVRKNIENFNFSIQVLVTCSFGIAKMKDGDTTDKLIQRADIAMYQAKNTGKNKICY